MTAPARAGLSGWLLWGGLVLFVLFWLAVMVVPPLIGDGVLAEAVRQAYAPFCHQDPVRSFRLNDAPMAGCSRCFALGLGALAALLIALLAGRVGRSGALPLWVPLAAAAPMTIDFGLGFLGLWPNTFTSRAVTGMLAGGFVAAYVLTICTDGLAKKANSRSEAAARGTGTVPTIVGGDGDG